MRKLLKNYPEVVLVDATHSTNSLKYKLFSFMIMDAFGKGQFVQHSILYHETTENLTSIAKTLKSNNSTWKEIKVFIVDKHFTEINVLKKCFPNSEVLLCQFHVIQYFKKKINSLEFNLGNRAIRENLISHIYCMIYAKSPKEFDYFYEKLVESVPNMKLNEFVCYFDKNWGNCQDMWVSYRRNHVPHLSNNTNNRLERNWGVLKHVLHRNMSLDETFNQILFFMNIQESKFNNNISKIGRLMVRGYDKELNDLLQYVSLWTSKILKKQIDLVDVEAYSILPGDTSERCVIQRISSPVGSNPEKYHIDQATFNCSCPHMATMLLPCKHVMMYRIHIGESLIVPLSSLNIRWIINYTYLRNHNVEVCTFDEVSQNFILSKRSASAIPEKALTSNQKYIKAKHLFDKISDEISELGTKEFKEWLGIFQMMSINLREKTGRDNVLQRLGDIRKVSTSKDDIEKNVVEITSMDNTNDQIKLFKRKNAPGRKKADKKTKRQITSQNIQSVRNSYKHIL